MWHRTFYSVRFIGLQSPPVGMCQVFEINISPFVIPEDVDAQAPVENPGE